MPPLDSMASWPRKDEEIFAEMKAMRHELDTMRAQQQANKMAQVASLSSTGPAAISGSYGMSYAGGGSYISPGRATISSGAMYAPPAPVDFIGPFTFAQMKLMEHRFVGIWDVRKTNNTKPNQLPIDEYWFAPSESYATQPKQTNQQMGDWQMGYDKGYEDGKAGK